MTSHAISFLSEDKKLKKNSLADKRSKRVTLATKFFTLEEVQLLAQTLEVKFNLICHINKLRNGYVIRISAKSLPVLQDLLKDIMPPMMLHKIGL